MDAVATMGNVLPDEAGGRDAVHVAVFSASSEEKLFPGQDVAIIHMADERDAKVTGNTINTHHLGAVGVVDPFLKSAVFPGERFWVYLYPRTITALSHRWSHPAFEATESVYVPPATKLESEQWLQDFCQSNDAPCYDDLIKAVTGLANGKTRESWGDEGEWKDYHGWWTDGEYLGFGGQDAHCAIPPELWHHIEIVIGRPINGPKPTYFTCSC